MKKSRKINLGERVVVLAITLAIPAFVGWRNIFSVFSYEIKREKTEAAEAIFWRNGYLVISNPLAKENFLNEIKLKIYLEEESKLNCCQLKVKQAYEASDYPLGAKIANKDQFKEYLFFNNSTKIPNGTLASNKGSVFMISQGKRRPILNAEVFNQKGFNWKSVIALNDQAIKQFPLGEKIRVSSPHPEGTILEDSQGNWFLVWGKQRLPISNKEDVKELWPQVWQVKTASKKFDQCRIIRSSSQKKECVFLAPLNPISPGDSFLIKFNAEKNANLIRKAEVFVETSLESREQIVAAWRAFKRRVKNKLIHKFKKDEENI